MPSTWPMRFLVAVLPGRAGSADRKPFWIHRTRVRVERSFVSIRTVCARVTASSLPTCSTRSVWGHSSSKRSVVNGGDLDEGCRDAVDEAGPHEQAAAEPDGDGQAVRVRRECGLGVAERRQSLGQAGGVVAHQAQHGVGARGVVVAQVETDEGLQCRRRRVDAGLVRTVEGHHCARRCGFGGRAGGGRRGRPGRGSRPRGGVASLGPAAQGEPAGGAEDRGATGGKDASPGEGRVMRHRGTTSPACRSRCRR